MRRRLPPLTALRAFEAAARRLSISRAADELLVTPAAISHHIRALEGWLGVRLFHRVNGALRLTPTGEVYFKGISVGLDRLWEATENLEVRDPRQTVTLVVPPSFAGMWLVPRLHRFLARVPNMQIRVTSAGQPIDFSQHQMDMGIRYGWEVGPEHQRWPLLRYELLPVCAPSLLEGQHPLREPADLRHHRLIHDEGLRIHDRVDWRTWLDIAGVDGIDPNRGVRFSSPQDAYQFARNGHGVALAKTALVKADLDAGVLVAPFSLRLPSDFTYDMICPNALATSERVLVLREWLEDEARKDGVFAGA